MTGDEKKEDRSEFLLLHLSNHGDNGLSLAIVRSVDRLSVLPRQERTVRVY